MNSEKFVDEIIKERVKIESIESVLRLLEKPGGRHPNKDIIENSNWYNDLSENDKIFVRRVISKAVDMTLFAFLGMLDGIGFINNNGDYELYYIDKKTKERILLNNPDEMELHALYNAVEE